MSPIGPFTRAALPALVAAAGDRAAYRFLEFFTAQIRNANTRKAYMRSVSEFCDWVAGQGGPRSLRSVRSMSPSILSSWVGACRRSHTRRGRAGRNLGRTRRHRFERCHLVGWRGPGWRRRQAAA